MQRKLKRGPRLRDPAWRFKLEGGDKIFKSYKAYDRNKERKELEEELDAHSLPSDGDIHGDALS